MQFKIRFKNQTVLELYLEKFKSKLLKWPLLQISSRSSYLKCLYDKTERERAKKYSFKHLKQK